MDKRLRAIVFDLPRPAKRIIVMIVDAGLAIFAVWLAYYLRLGQFLSLWEITAGFRPLPAVIVAVFSSIPIFMLFGLYRVIFRYAGAPAVLAVTKAITFYGIIFATLFTLVGVPGVPRTIGIIQPIILFLLVALSRFAARFWLGGM
jgi:FlaA1/EpsC-like NDP-sugar epimerase